MCGWVGGGHQRQKANRDYGGWGGVVGGGHHRGIGVWLEFCFVFVIGIVNILEQSL